MHTVVGRYRVEHCLGEGGMGVVYAARDGELERTVAIKMLKTGTDEASRERFRREARTAASLNHPAICQVFEIGEHDGELFIVMELLEGESLAARLTRGAMSIDQAATIALAVLGAVAALHTRGFVHRDIKPSNIYLARHGVKLLDFGLAGAFEAAANQATQNRLTVPGGTVGTPQYMSPEALSGAPVDARADLHAVGIVLFEMASGRALFSGRSLAEIVHAIATDRPPVLAGSPGAAVVDRVVHRALQKNPDDRYRSATDMAADLTTALDGSGTGGMARAAIVTRLIALPFRVLRSDPETDFLAFSLPDAIGTSMSALESVVVRSSHTASRFASDAPDLREIAAQADVDAVLVGTLLRAGSRIRVNTQLLEAPSGTVLCSQSSQVELDDVFALQDSLAQQISESLAVPLSAREGRRRTQDVPASPEAYELYLRANRAGHDATTSDTASLENARDLYLRCVDADPGFAPAWARLGRIFRVMAKWGRTGIADNTARAETAFRRALELNPELPLAHNLYAQLEVDLGRAEDAILRLLARARAHGADPELFAGLVQACRFSGLLDASVAAHRRARRFDPGITTSVGHTYFMLGEYERVIDPDLQITPATGNAALAMLGREAEAIAAMREAADRIQTRYSDILISYGTLLEGRRAESLAAARRLVEVRLQDPEVLYHAARVFSRNGEYAEAIDVLQTAIDTGFRCYRAMQRDPWLEPVRARGGFAALNAKAREWDRANRLLFRNSGGEAVLGAVESAVMPIA